MKKYVVTGGSGFIGSHLMDQLMGKGNEVLNFDISPPRFGHRDLFREGNILDIKSLEMVFEGADTVFHLAAQAKVTDYFNNPVAGTDVNVMGTVNVLEAARKKGVKRVIFASTEWVYGGVPEAEVDENTRVFPPTPNHLYSASKIAGEMACMNYQSLYGQAFTVMRFGIPFGERAWHATVTPIFLNKILRGEELTVSGQGDSFRQFVYVKDLVAGIEACAKPEGANQIINLNGARPVTVLEIIRTIEEVLGVQAKVKSVYERPGDFKGKLVSSKKAKELLGWAPVVEYKAAMKHYIEWFKANDFNG